MAQKKTRFEDRSNKAAAKPPRRFWRIVTFALAVVCLIAASAWYCWGWTQCRSAEDDIAHWRNYLAFHKTEKFPFPFDRSWRKDIIRAKAFRRDCDIVSAAEELDLARKHGVPAKVLEEEELLLDAHRGKIEPVRLRYVSARDTILGDTQDYCHSIAMGYLAILEPERGMTFVNQWMETHPESVEPNVALARFLIDGRNYPAAIARLEKTLEVEPDHNAARFLLILAYGKQAQLEKMLEQQELLMSYPEHRVVGQTGYADTLARLGQVDEAEQSLAELERDFPETKDSPRVNLVRSQIYLMRGDVQAAAKLLEEYLKAFPHNPIARFRYGTALNRLGRHDEAEAYTSNYRDELAAQQDISELSMRVKRFPDDLDAKVDLAEQLLKVKEHQRAVDLLAEVFLRDPLHERGYNMMVEHFKKTDQLEKLEKIVRLHDDVIRDKSSEEKAAHRESSDVKELPPPSQSGKSQSGSTTQRRADLTSREKPSP
jgi:tetratricopeptide (TPR) repeat protein